MRRKGQTFYVFNSIAGIEEKKKVLLRLLPKLHITELLLKDGEIRKLACPKCGYDDYIDFESWGLQFYDTAFK
jgi:hypothetical protein